MVVVLLLRMDPSADIRPLFTLEKTGLLGHIEADDMKILHIYGLGDTSFLLADAMNELGTDTHVLVSNSQFKIHLPGWMREYPNLEGKIHVHHSQDLMDPMTNIEIGRFANSFDMIICHAPAFNKFHMFKKPFCIWDGGASYFIWRDKDISVELIYDREVSRRSYYKAKYIFLSDMHCLYSKRYPKRLLKNSIPVPLPVDLRTFFPQKEPDPDTFNIYFPTRQIQEGKCILDVIKGLQHFCLYGKNIKIHIADYGRDVEISKAKVREYGLEAITTFFKPVPKQQFARMLSHADVVIDQLVVGAYGGVSAEAMACETPVICNIHQPWYEKHYEHVPILHAKTPFDIQAQLKKVHWWKYKDKQTDDPTPWKGFGIAGRRFVEKYHDHKKVAKRVLEVIEQ